MIGILHKNERQSWEIVSASRAGDALELTEGDVVEIRVGGQWRRTGIDRKGQDYFATTAGVELREGLPARTGDWHTKAA